MEALSKDVEKGNRWGLHISFNMSGRGGEGMEVSHLLFANNVLFSCNANQEQMEYLGFSCGLKINTRLKNKYGDK